MQFRLSECIAAAGIKFNVSATLAAFLKQVHDLGVLGETWFSLAETPPQPGTFSIEITDLP